MRNMRKTFGLMIGASVAMIMLASCDGKNKKSEDSTLFEFKEYHYKMLAKSSDMDPDDYMFGDGSRLVEGEIILPLRINDNDITELRDSLISMTGVIVDEDGEVLPNLDADEGFKLVSDNPNMAEPSTSESSFTTICLINQKIIVWQNDYFSYDGGAHGYGSSVFVNYSIELNKVLTLNDIFTRGFEDKLNEIVRKNLRAFHSEELYDTGYSTMNDIEYSNVFRLYPNAIEFYYAPYMIGPYSSGIITCTIGLEELENAGIINREVKKQVFGL